MKLNTLFVKGKPSFSLEIFPPKKSTGIERLYQALEDISDMRPDFISVTYGAGGGIAGQNTLDIASHIKSKLLIEPLAHLTCVNLTKEEAKNMLESFKLKGIENVLALRGDIVDGVRLSEDFPHSSDLARFISQNSDINIVGACYPEGHFESESLDKDIENLKYKIDNGVTHLITQLFFDNNKLYSFMDKLRAKNISVPVEAGIMPITTTRQIERTVALSGASLPSEFTQMVSRYSQNEEALFHSGIAYAIEQIDELVDSGLVDGVHVYTMNNQAVAREVYKGVKNKLKR